MVEVVHDAIITTTEPSNDPTIPDQGTGIGVQDPPSQGTVPASTPPKPQHPHTGPMPSTKGLFLRFRDVGIDSLEAVDIIALKNALLALALDDTLSDEIRQDVEEKLANLASLRHHMEVAASFANRLAAMPSPNVAKLDTDLKAKLQEKVALVRPRQILQEKIKSDEALLEEIHQRIFINQQALSSLVGRDSTIDGQIGTLEADKKRVVRSFALERGAEEKSADSHLNALNRLWEKTRVELVAFAEILPPSP